MTKKSSYKTYKNKDWKDSGNGAQAFLAVVAAEKYDYNLYLNQSHDDLDDDYAGILQLLLFCCQH